MTPPPDGTVVTLLDEQARPAGTMAKLEAHVAPGRRHLAYSVVLRDDEGRVLLQRRAETKYHFAGLWGNSCCSHPAPNEPVVEAARRRVAQELGVLNGLDLAVHGAFWYRAEDPVTGLVEHEYDIVLLGRLGHGPLRPDPMEVAELAWYEPRDAVQVACDPMRGVPWLAGVLEVAKTSPQEVANDLLHGSPD